MATAKDEKGLQPIQDAIGQAIVALQKTGPDAKLLADVKSNQHYGLLMSFETPAALAGALAMSSSSTGDPHTLDQLAKAMAAITPGDVQAFAKKYLVPKNETVVVVRPPATSTTAVGWKERRPAMNRSLLAVLGAALLVACPHAPPPMPRPAYKVPAERVILPSEKPLVSFRLFFLAGSMNDPPGKEGLTALTAQLMAQGGTETLSGAEFQAALFPLAAELSVEAGTEDTVFVGRVHQDLLDKFVPLLTAAIAHPRFDPKEFERLRSDALDDLQVRLRHNDDEGLGKAALQALLYDGHPFGFPSEGTVSGLKAITLDDVKSQWRTFFTRDRLMIGLIGKAATSELADRVAEGLSSLPREGAPLAVLPEPTDDGVKALLVEKTTDSTAFSLGYTYDVLRSDADFAALWVGNSALGEHRQLGGILFHELRELRGLNYGDYTYLEHFVQGEDTYPEPNHDRHLQDFSVWIRPVVNENRGFALRAALYEVDRVLKDGLTAEQVERSKAFLKSYTLAWQAADGRRLGYALDDLFYGTPGFLQGFRDKLPSITADQVNAALRAHIDPQKLRYAIVTQHAQAFRDELLAGSPSAIKYDSPKPPDVLAEDKQIDVLPLPLNAANTKLLNSEQLFENRALGFRARRRTAPTVTDGH